MARASGERGVTGTEILLCLLLASIFIAGYAAIDSPSKMEKQKWNNRSYGYAGVSTAPRPKEPWWEREDYKPSETERLKETTYALDNKMSGLVSADDINWPYGSTYEYEMVLGAYPAYSVYPGKGWFTCNYSKDKTGITLEEEFEFQLGNKNSQDWLLFRTTSNMDLQHRVNSVKFESIQLEKFNQGGDELAYKTPMYNLSLDDEEGKLHWVTKVHSELAASYGVNPNNPVVKDMTIDSPVDGFHFFTGADSPGHVALNLQAFLDGDTSVYWTAGGGNLALFTSVDGSLIRAEPNFNLVGVVDLNTHDGESSNRRWLRTRIDFNGWTPPPGVRKVMLMGFGGNYGDYFQNSGSKYKYGLYKRLYESYSDTIYAYVDKMDRVVRVEQIGGAYCTAAELRKIDGQPVNWSN